MSAGAMAGIGAAPGAGFIAPIGSNKGSVVAEDAGAGPAQANGIIAILIGLQAPAQPTPTVAESSTPSSPFVSGICSCRPSRAAAQIRARTTNEQRKRPPCLTSSKKTSSSRPVMRYRSDRPGANYFLSSNGMPRIFT